MPNDRQQSAYKVRVEAADLARHRVHPVHTANPDESRYGFANYPMSFTKGLEHDVDTGLVKDPDHFRAFRSAIDEGFIEPFTTRVPVPTVPKFDQGACRRRMWEAPTAGITYDLQGPDAQAVTMPPAPALCSDELAFEMAEVYELALLRDVPLNSFDQDGGTDSGKLNAALERLNALPYMKYRQKCCEFEGRPRKTDASGKLTRQTAFRGSGPGVENGPYLSQFLLVGNGKDVGEMELGFIEYGPQQINQRVRIADKEIDYMQIWNDWLTVQEGFDVNHCNLGRNNDNECSRGQRLASEYRFIHTPRDLATYVHFDALYQAYLNATLILLSMKTPFDPGFDKLAGMRDVYNPAFPPDMNGERKMRQNAGGFALFGGPHILSLVTEVATRGLKAVRYQKFNNHLRLRPEALAARMDKAKEIEEAHPALCGAFTKMRAQIEKTVEAVADFNERTVTTRSALLPMAFAEGSPMHPTYGAGHATVAGACTTIVKAFFDTGTVLGFPVTDDPCARERPGFYSKISKPVVFDTVNSGRDLRARDLMKGECPLTLEGELNKLAANIAIGRNMAGVHYYSDYYDSLRMGEQIAIGILEEQALCYPTDDFVLTVPTFDGGIVRIGRK